MGRLTFSKITLAACLGPLAGAAGCASVLGDFSTGSSPGEGPGDGASPESGLPGTGAGAKDQSVPDTSVSDTGPSSDGSVDAGHDAATGDASGGDVGPLPTLSCNAWKTAQPARLADLHASSGNAAAYQGITAFAPDTHTVRIVAQRSGNPIVFSVYSVDTSTSPPVMTSVDLPLVGAGPTFVERVVRLDQGFGVIVANTNAMGYYDLTLYPFLDAKPVTPLPMPVPLVTFPETSSTYLRDFNVIQVGVGAYFFVMLGQSTGFTLEMGLAVGGNQAAPAFVDSNPNLHQFDGLTMVHVGTHVFIYCAGYESQPIAFYEVPDTAGATGPRTMVANASGSVFTPIIADGVPGSPASPANTTNLVLQQGEVNDAGQFSEYAFNVAPIANAALPTLAASAISFGVTYTDFASAPLGIGPRLFGDDMVSIGQGEDSDQNPTLWFNFLWLNASGVVRANRGGVGALLADRASLITSISAAPGAITRTSGAWNIVWSEFDPQDGGAGYGALYMNELDCQP
jgi:hypothetical protein